MRDLVLSGQNVALMGPRRTGKTSLALEVCRKAKRKVVHADMMRVDSYAEVIKRLVEACIRDNTSGRIEGFIKNLAYLRPTFAIDPISGGAQWTVSPSAKSTPENVIDTLRLIEQRCRETGAIVFIDEFQDLTALPRHEGFIAQMRAEIQKWSDTAIIFAGSDRDLMKALFMDPSNPFYQAATVLHIDTIDETLFRKHIELRFEQSRKAISSECLDAVLTLTDQHPNSAQKLLYFLWNQTDLKGTADSEILSPALELIIRAEQDEFERTLTNLTLMQARALTTVARIGGENTVSADFLETARIRNPTSCTKALMRCVQLKILLKDRSRYHFTNPFFREWLKNS